MRLLQVLVSEDELESVTDALEEEGIDHVRQRTWTDGEADWLVEFPVPTDAIGYVTDRLEAAGVDGDRYTTIVGLEGAMTPRAEPLQERFAGDFDPVSRPELRSKARDMSYDTRSYLALMVLSAVIAVAGLLVESTAIVVGSMVIAPFVGPVTTVAVGAVTSDRSMLVRSLWIQGIGVTVAVVGAAAFSVSLRLVGLFPAALDVTSIEPIALRVAPNAVTAVVGLAAGAAGAYGLATKGPTALIGVMIAAALVPAAATVGIATAWGHYRIAVGSLLLLVMTLLLVDAGAFVVLRRYYGPEREGWLLPGRPSHGRLAVAGTALALVVLVAVVGVASYQQVAFERAVTEEVAAITDDPAYGDLEVVTVRVEYAGSLLGSPETVTVVLSRTADGSDPPMLAGELDRRIDAATGRDVAVRVRFREYQRAA